MSGLARSVKGDVGVNPPGTRPSQPAHNQPPRPQHLHQQPPQPQDDAPRPAQQPPQPQNDAPRPPQPLPPPDGARSGAISRLVGAPRALLLAALAIAALFWWLSLTLICPVAWDAAAAAPSGARSVSSSARYDGGTEMLTDALLWLGYLKGQAAPDGPAAIVLTYEESATIAEYIADLSRGVVEIGEVFTQGDMFEAQELDTLEARLYRARDEARYFEDAMWPRLGCLYCLPCGFLPLTLPCPGHPVSIARREAESVTRVLMVIASAHWEVLKQHEDVQAEGLDGAHDVVCLVSKDFPAIDTDEARGQPGVVRLLDLGSAAFAVCRLTGREKERGEQFREHQLWDFMDVYEWAKRRVNTISGDLDKALVRLSWSRDHIEEGIKAIDGLLEVVHGLR